MFVIKGCYVQAKARKSEIRKKQVTSLKQSENRNSFLNTYHDLQMLPDRSLLLPQRHHAQNWLYIQHHSYWQ
jgi:hypothetical protein